MHIHELYDLLVPFIFLQFYFELNQYFTHLIMRFNFSKHRHNLDKDIGLENLLTLAYSLGKNIKFLTSLYKVRDNQCK